MDMTYYELLAVKPTASYEEIKSAYKANIAKYHPDLNKAPNANQLSAWINAAWETLSDPDRRAEYDRSIGLAGKSGAGQGPGRDTGGGEAQKEAEWKKQKEAAEAERRRRQAEAERQRREAEAARQRAAAEEQRKAQEAARQKAAAEEQWKAQQAARQRAAEEERQKQQQLAETLRQIQAAEAAKRRRRDSQRILLTLVAVIIGIIIFRTLSSPSKSVSNEVSGIAPTAQPTVSQRTPWVTIKTPAPENERALASPVPRITYAVVHKPIAASETASGQSHPALVEATTVPKSPVNTSAGVSQGSQPLTDSGSGLSCSDRTITQVSDEGATVTLSDGNSYAVSTSYMRFEASDWSTGDRVLLCRLGTAASITNSDHLDQKVQVAYQGANVAQAVTTCSNRTITQVSDEGATVTLSDGNLYAVSTSYMRFEAGDWSTGDRALLCRSGTAASITNSDHLDQKVQVVYQGANVAQAVTCSNRTITQVSHEGATVTLNDGNSYAVSTSYMRFEAGDWSTGDRVLLCCSGTAASITNSDHLDQKIQAVRE